MSSQFARVPDWRPLALVAAAVLFGAAGTASAQREAVKISPSNGETGVWAGNPITLSFDRDVDLQSVKDAFSLTPATEGTWRTDARYASFEPAEPLLPNTAYTARLETTARDARGNALLSAPLVSAFTTAQDGARPHFSGALPLRYVHPTGDRLLQFEPGYSRLTLDFTLYAVDAAGTAERVAALPAWQWPQPNIPTDGLVVATTWQQHVVQGDKDQHPKLPEGVGPGLYVLDVRSPRITPAQALVVVTDHALVAKVGADGLTVWDSLVPGGEPVAGAAVQALAADGTVLGSATTDADGLADVAGAAGAALVVATHDGVPTIAGLGGAWQSSGWWWGGRTVDATRPAAQDDGRGIRLAGHAHTDRPIYRPGHDVHWKATLRAVTLDGYALPTAPLTATIRDAGGNLVWRNRVSPDAFGSVQGDLALDVDAALGGWSLIVSDGASEVYGSFQVQEYVKPDFEVTVTPERDWYVRGQTAAVEVEARYYFGQPAAGAEVVLRVFEGWWWRGSGQTPTQELRGTLDDEGLLSFDVALSGNPSSSQPMWFEAEVVDASRRPVVSEAQVTVHPAAFALSLESARYGVEAGEDVVLTARTADHDGGPMAGVRVTVDVIQYRYPGGEHVEETHELTTGQDGTAELRLPDLQPGWFSLRARAADAQGHEVQAYSYAWVFDAVRPWYWWGGLEVDLDHDAYAPGETARLLVKSPVTTTALITIERDEVYDELVVPISGATTVEVPIRPEYAPNATVRVALWQPTNDPYRTIDSSLLVAERTLVVPAEEQRLQVTVSPDAAQHAPRDQATWTVRVTDPAGNPVRAQLSLAVVDKSVLALATDASGDVFDAFWTNWPGSVSTYDSHRAADGYGGFVEDRAGGPGGGPPPAGSPQPAPTQTAGAPTREDEASQATPRREFPDTALWRATLETGADGTATVPMTLPDSLTTWVALARAVDVGARAGQGTGEMVVSQPIVADVALPRFAVQGDRFAVDVLGRNYAQAGATLDGDVQLASPGLVQLDPGTRDLALPFNQTAFARYSVVASTLGAAPVTASLDTPAGGDAVELPLEVAPFTVPDRVVRAGSTDAKAFETIDVPFNAVPGGSRLEVRLSPGAALSVIDGIEELIGYPYGCVEQTMSRMLPNAVVGRLVAELGLQAPEVTESLPAYMTIGLQKLYGFQNADGGWGWWSGDPQVYLTAYVLHGLILTRQAGFDVDQGALDRGTAWLTAHFAAEADPRMQAYAAYVLSQAGADDAGRSAALFAAAADRLDAAGLASLALALDAAGEAALAGQALDRLVAKADVGPSTAFWPMEVRDRWEPYHWRSMATEEKNTALALSALTTLRPGDALAPKAARWLLEHRHGPGWRTTQGTAYAVLGLTDYLLTSGELDAEFTWTVKLGERTVASGSVDRSNITTRIPPVVIEGENLPAGSHQLVLEKAGRGTLFYSAVADLARYYDGFAPASAEGYGVTLRREYLPVSGRSDAGGWHVGDVINVRLTLETREELWYMLAEDMLPAGFEALNEALETEGRVPGGDRPFWRWWGYERKEVRDERVTFFATYLPAGTHVFEYAARAVTPGEFSARPATAYAMYRPEVWGRSASDQVAVAADRVAERPALPGDFDRDCRLTPFDASLVAESWSAGRGRDLTGDGTVTVADVAVAAGRGRTAAACGEAVGLVAPAGQAVELGLREEGDGTVTTFDVAVTLAGDAPVGAWEVRLELPSGMTATAVRAGDRLPDAALLPLTAEPDGSVRLGGWAEADAESGDVLAVVTLSRSADAVEVALAAAEVTTADGRAYEVTHEGGVISPPVRPIHRVYLPMAAR